MVCDIRVETSNVVLEVIPKIKETDRLVADADAATNQTETTRSEVRFSFRGADNVRTLDVRASYRVVNRVEVIRKRVALDETTTSGTLLVIRTIALMVLDIRRPIERPAFARREAMTALLGDVIRKLVLVTDKLAPLVFVEARIVVLLVQGHGEEIFLVCVIRPADLLRITHRGARQTSALRWSLRGW